MLGTILSVITGGAFDAIRDLGTKLIAKQISLAEFEAQTKKSLVDAQTKTEEAWAQASSQQFESLQATLRVSPIMQRAYAVALITQLFVLVWYQWGVSAYQIITGDTWPVPTATIEWAYLLLGGMLGIGPLVFGRGASAISNVTKKP